MATELVGGNWAQFAVARREASAAPCKRYGAKTTLFDPHSPDDAVILSVFEAVLV
jgi:hypothetical protein